MNLFETSDGLQIEYVNTANNQRHRITMTWKELFADCPSPTRKVKKGFSIRRSRLGLDPGSTDPPIRQSLRRKRPVAGLFDEAWRVAGFESDLYVSSGHTTPITSPIRASSGASPQ